MNREIKFRAWDEKTRRMWNRPKFSLDRVLDEYERGDKSTILLQYTGLHDRKGKEIYEGDVVRDKEGVGQVIWERDGYYLLTRNELWKDDWSKFEVIGNIYENKELLEGGD